MGDIETIEASFRSRLGSRIRLKARGVDRYLVLTPFVFEDGDHLKIVAKRVHDQWYLTDEGHTLMHLSYFMEDTELSRATRRDVIEHAVDWFGISNVDGVLMMPVASPDAGDALFTFTQGLLRISDVTLLQSDRARSAFMEDLFALLRETIPEERRTFNWHDPVHDKRATYTVDCRANGLPVPLFIYGVPGDDKARDVTINLNVFKRWGVRNSSLVVFQNQETIGPRILAKLSDVCDKQFSSLTDNEDLIRSNLRERFV